MRHRLLLALALIVGSMCTPVAPEPGDGGTDAGVTAGGMAGGRRTGGGGVTAGGATGGGLTAGGGVSAGGSGGGGVTAGGSGGGGERLCTRNTGGSNFVPATEFLTSVPLSADFGSRREADARCNLAASGAGLDRAFVAWLADSTSWPMDEFFQGMFSNDGPDLFVSVACADPYGGRCYGNDLSDEHGRLVDAGGLYWAGFSERCQPGRTCQNWTSRSGAADLGVHVKDGLGGVRPSAGSCSDRYQLLCRATEPQSTQPLDGGSRRLFVTSAEWTGSLGGRVGANARCNALALDAGLQGGFRAFLGEGSFHPAMAFSNRAVWRLSTGALAFRNTDSFATTPVSPLMEDERGVPLDGGLIWTGVTTWKRTSGFDCASWTSTSSMGTTGAVGSVTERWTDDGVRSCSALAHLLCLQD
ncbi:MAG: hypothetical protein Q8L14_24075 [Myxococcales bacterium]|nr:hypothetical protein [Myxococcales bacterium]